MRDHPLLGIPVMPSSARGPGRAPSRRTSRGLPRSRATRRAETRKDFVYGEDVALGEWTAPNGGPPGPAGGPDALRVGAGPPRGRHRPERDGYASDIFGMSPFVFDMSITANAAPCWSVSAAKRPKGLSIGPKWSVPPCFFAFATASSQSGTAK
ncbi:hypothetical protein OV450_5305 [Actinobacteria bacterium OV450]|nr:hypothetical protein OV450_5305 [Actinobacteria bacterium OV450]